MKHFLHILIIDVFPSDVAPGCDSNPQLWTEEVHLSQLLDSTGADCITREVEPFVVVVV